MGKPSEHHIQRCPPDQYKEQKERRVTEESNVHLATMSPNADKNVPEQKAMTVDTGGYEQPVEDVNRPNVESASELVKNLQKKLEDITTERDNLSNENKIIKEKTT